MQDSESVFCDPPDRDVSRRKETAKPLSRQGVEDLIEDAVNDLSVVNKAITPRNVQEYVAGNVQLYVELGHCLQPAPKDLDEALEWSRLEARCAFENLQHGSHPRM